MHFVPQLGLNMAAPRPRASPIAGKESLTTLAEKVDLKGQRVFVRVDFNGAWVWGGGRRFGPAVRTTSRSHEQQQQQQEGRGPRVGSD